MTASSAPKQTGLASYVVLVRTNRNFRYMWFGQIVSLLGDWFNLIASAALVASLTDSGLAVGGLFVVRMLAPFLVSPLAGVVADRVNRQRVLVLTDVARGVVVLGFLLVSDPAHVWLLYALTAAQLGISGFFQPAWTSILPDLVDARDVGTANALGSSTWSVMLAFGAALGGLVAGSWGARPAFIIDSLTFFASAVLIAQIRYRPPAALDEGPVSLRPGAVMGPYLEGLRYLWRHADTLVIALQKAVLALIISAPLDIIQVRLSEDVFVIGEGGGASLGLLLTMQGIGTGIGPIAFRYITGDRDRAQRWAITAAYGLMVAGLLIVMPLWNFGSVLVGALVRAMGGGTLWVFSTQLLLQQVPAAVRGRVFATEFALFTLWYAVGSTLAGGLLENGLDYSVLLGTLALLACIPGLLWTVWFTRWARAVPVAHEPARSAD